MIRNKSCVFEASAWKCIVSLPFFLKNSRTQSTNTLEYCIFESLDHLSGCRIPSSFRCARKSHIPLLFVSKTEDRPMSLRESLRVFLNFFWILNANCIISFYCPIDVVGHSHEDDPVCKFFRFNVPFSPIVLHFLKNLQWRTQLLVHPFPVILCKNKKDILNSSTWPSHFVIASLLSFIFPKHWNGICVNTFFCFCAPDHLIVTIRISSTREFQCQSYSHSDSECSNIKFCFFIQKKSQNFFEVCVLVDLQVRQIIRSNMNGCFHWRRHEHSVFRHICL